MTNINIRKANINSENEITGEHINNNRDVRGLLVKSGIKPENLKAEEDLKKIERNVKLDDKKVLKSTTKLNKK